jgi:hypothetical protein
MRRVIIAAFALPLLAACQTATTELTEQQSAEIAAEIMMVVDGLMDAWNAEDATTSLSFFDSEALNILWGETEYDNRESFSEFWSNLWDAIPSWEGAWDDTFVRPLSLNTAVFRGRYHCTFTHTGVVETFRPHWTAILERRVDGWKMTVIDHAYGTAEVVEEA